MAGTLPRKVVDEINYRVNLRFRHCPGVWSCTSDFHPALYGDCKQAAAEKLRELILAGAKPQDYTIWTVRIPGGLHAVLVENDTGRVLDSLLNPVETMAFKAKYEAMEFKSACPECDREAERAAALRRATPADR